MLKISIRRFSFLNKNLTSLFICFIIIILLIYNQHTDYNDEYEKNSWLQSSTIPPHYLLIRYQEFAMRTSISCRSFKLDQPKKDLTNFHPRYSSHLKGTFKYIIPDSNITYDDIEEFYTKTLVNKNNDSLSINTSFANDIPFENIPYRYENGMWYPIGIISAQRTAILIPLQGRDYNAKAFILNIHAFARRQLLTYKILLIEQAFPPSPQFNKGRLFNAGVRYLEKQSLNITCFILHDVDLIPENDGNFYTCESRNPKHTTIRVRPLSNQRGYTRYYEFLIGGVLLLTSDMYKTVNGFSNLYWGWGGEDDDLSLRLIECRMCVVRPTFGSAIYVALPHTRGQRNSKRFNLLTWASIRLHTDGYNKIDSMIRIVHIQEISTVTHLKLDVDADHSLYKPPVSGQLNSRSDETNVYITSTGQPISTTTIKDSTSSISNVTLSN